MDSFTFLFLKATSWIKLKVWDFNDKEGATWRKDKLEPYFEHIDVEHINRIPLIPRN